LSINLSIVTSDTIAIDQCGHEPQVECPEAFDKALEAFLE